MPPRPHSFRRVVLRGPFAALALLSMATGCWPFVTSSGGGQTQAPGGQGAGEPAASAPAAPAANPPPAQPAASPQPAPAVYQATVSVHNACPKRVRLFRGRTNGRYPGSGTYGWHGVNTTSSYHLSGDDELCIVEDDRLILACVKPPSGASVEVSESCGGFRNR